MKNSADGSTGKATRKQDGNGNGLPNQRGKVYRAKGMRPTDLNLRAVWTLSSLAGPERASGFSMSYCGLPVHRSSLRCPRSWWGLVQEL